MCISTEDTAPRLLGWIALEVRPAKLTEQAIQVLESESNDLERLASKADELAA